MIVVKLRDAMEAFWSRTGQKLTYARVAEMSGVSESALKKIARDLKYNPALPTVEKLCNALNVGPGEILEIIPDPPEPEYSPKKPKKKKKTTKKKKKKS